MKQIFNFLDKIQKRKYIRKFTFYRFFFCSFFIESKKKENIVKKGKKRKFQIIL